MFIKGEIGDVEICDPDGNFHIVKKKKKKGGFFRIFSSIFFIIVGIITLQPELVAFGAAEASVSLVNIGMSLASIAQGIAGLASGTGGLGETGPPGLLGSPDFGLDLAAAGFLGEFFSPALRLAAETCENCPDSRLDLLRLLLGLFQVAEAEAAQAPRPPPKEPGIGGRGSGIGRDRGGSRRGTAAHRREWTEPRDLAEALTVSEARAGMGEPIMRGRIRDPQYPADTWDKMQHVHTRPDGSKIVIHYWQNLKTGEREGFKFVLD